VQDSGVDSTGSWVFVKKAINLRNPSRPGIFLTSSSTRMVSPVWS